MRVISFINLLKNQIPVEQAQELVKVMQAEENLTSLCGLSRRETSIYFSGQYLGAGDAVLIANDIRDMGALSSLNLSNSFLGCGLFQGNSHGWETSKGHTKAEDNPANYAADTTGIIAVADAIPGMGALTSLNLASNAIGGYEDENHTFIATPEG
jgi:hypothetical protein